MDYLILAGGFGSRLKSVVNDRPKPMALINNRPFLFHLLSRIIRFNCSEIFISVGYQKEFIKDYFGDSFKGFKINYVEENKPLGTGGAVIRGFAIIPKPYAIVINGDTLTDINYKKIQDTHEKDGNSLISVKQISNPDRYDLINFDELSKKVINFSKSSLDGKSFINTGTYLIKKNNLLTFKAGNYYSMERDILPYLIKINDLYVFENDHKFIDIGIPQDYEKLSNRFSEYYA